jgi:spoIIIJ-associated protein
MSESPTTTAQPSIGEPTSAQPSSAQDPDVDAGPDTTAGAASAPGGSGEPAAAPATRARRAGKAAPAVRPDDLPTDGTGSSETTVTPTPEAKASKAEESEAEASTNGASTDGAAPRSGRRRVPDTATLEQEGEVAADYLEELLDICDLDGDLDLDVEGDRAIVAIVGTGLDHLVGPKGRVLDALQELTRLAVLAQTGQRSRLMLDIAGYRAGRRAELTTLGTETAQQVVASGEPRRLTAMTPFERKVVHDAVAAVGGVRSESEGEEPQRRVVVLPA